MFISPPNARTGLLISFKDCCNWATAPTTTGGSAELIRHQENALAFQAGASDDLAEQILRLADDEVFRIALIDRGRRYVEENHSIDVYSRNLEDFLRRACGHGG